MFSISVKEIFAAAVRDLADKDVHVSSDHFLKLGLDYSFVFLVFSYSSNY